MGFNPMQIVQMLQNSGNPMQMLMGLAGNNPQMKTAISMIQQAQSNGVSPQQLFQNLAQSKGMTAEQIQQMAGEFEAKM